MKGSQRMAILNYMQNVGPITGMIALREFDCMRLGARINELKNAGIDVKDAWVFHTNEDGETKRFKEYWV